MTLFTFMCIYLSITGHILAYTIAVKDSDCHFGLGVPYFCWFFSLSFFLDSLARLSATTVFPLLF